MAEDDDKTIKTFVAILCIVISIAIVASVYAIYKSRENAGVHATDRSRAADDEEEKRRQLE